MGSKHPVSLRLKKSTNWLNTSYHFCSRNGLHQFYGLDKIALNVIKHYFQFALISKPKFNKDSNKVVISFYYFLNLPAPKRSNRFRGFKVFNSSFKKNARINNNILLPFKAKGYSKLILKLSRFYGKPVELRPVRIHYPYLNSYILAQYLALNIKAGKFNKLMRVLFKKAKLVKNNNTISTNFRDLIKYSSLINSPYYLSGLKIQISGRLSQRKAASRTRIVRKSRGLLSLNSSNSLIDASKFSFKGKNGAVTVKVWLNSSPLNSLTNK